MADKEKTLKKQVATTSDYNAVLLGVLELLEQARRSSARAVNTIMTATYWEIGRRIVEYDQAGKKRAGYGEDLLRILSLDLSARFGRGFSRQNLQRFREFYLSYPPERICSTVSSISENKSVHPIRTTLSSKSGEQIIQTPSGQLTVSEIADCFLLPWSHYVRLLSVDNQEARRFYEAEALRGGWSVRQLDRQISTLFYERTALSRNKAPMLKKGQKPLAEDFVTPEEEIKDPLVLEFLGLKDEYSENDLEEALILHLESFLLELGGD